MEGSSLLRKLMSSPVRRTSPEVLTAAGRMGAEGGGRADLGVLKLPRLETLAEQELGPRGGEGVGAAEGEGEDGGAHGEEGRLRLLVSTVVSES